MRLKLWEQGWVPANFPYERASSSSPFIFACNVTKVLRNPSWVFRFRWSSPSFFGLDFHGGCFWDCSDSQGSRYDHSANLTAATFPARFFQSGLRKSWQSLLSRTRKIPGLGRWAVITCNCEQNKRAITTTKCRQLPKVQKKKTNKRPKKIYICILKGSW